MNQPGQPGKDPLTEHIARGGMTDQYRAKTVGSMGFLKDSPGKWLSPHRDQNAPPPPQNATKAPLLAPHQLVSQMPWKLSQIAYKAITRERSQRFGSAYKRRAALISFLRTQTTRVSPYPIHRGMVETFAPSILAEQRAQMADTPFFAPLQRQRAQPSPPHPLARGRPPCCKAQAWQAGEGLFIDSASLK